MTQTLPEEETLDWKRAEEARKAGEYARAGKAFHGFWREGGKAAAGWRYAFCLRKAGYPEPALQVANRVVARSPGDEWAAGELQWCLYAARLKPAVEAEDEGRVLAAARAMVEAGARGLALQMAVFAAVNAARLKGHWGEVARWCELLDPEALDDRPSEGPQGKKIPSPRERYWFARLKSLVELERWPQALSEAEIACGQFPRNLDFVRWKAQAMAGLGRPTEAVDLLNPLRRDRRARWYHLADLARFHLDAGSPEEAWTVAREALALPAEDQARVGLLATLARTGLALGHLEEAGRYLAWCLSLRREQGWPVPPPLEALARQFQQAGVALDPATPSRQLRGACLGNAPRPASRRQSPLESSDRGAVGPAPEPLPGAGPDGRFSGRVVGFQEGRNFAFVRLPQGPQVFVNASDLPADRRRDGAAVTFRAVANFDRKKGRQSWRAVQVEPA